MLIKRRKPTIMVRTISELSTIPVEKVLKAVESLATLSVGGEVIDYQLDNFIKGSSGYLGDDIFRHPVNHKVLLLGNNTKGKITKYSVQNEYILLMSNDTTLRINFEQPLLPPLAPSLDNIIGTKKEPKPLWDGKDGDKYNYVALNFQALSPKEMKPIMDNTYVGWVREMSELKGKIGVYTPQSLEKISRIDESTGKTIYSHKLFGVKFSIYMSDFNYASEILVPIPDSVVEELLGHTKKEGAA